MLRLQAFSLCIFPALSLTHLASDGGPPAAPPGPSASDAASARGTPALFSWADVDGDGRLDLAALSGEGTLQILISAGDGRFEDVTQRVGLFGVTNAAVALWADYDGDSLPDLFVGAREGASRLFHNERGSFLDVGARSGLSSEGAVESAQWFDYDSDGRIDLFVATAEKSQLFRGRNDGLFEVAKLPCSASDLERERTGTHPEGSVEPRGGEDSNSNAVSAGVVPTGPYGRVQHVMAPCVDTIRDQCSGACLVASSCPAIGKLYPISQFLFVDNTGYVGINTTSPIVNLDVAGDARVSGGTLTLNPSPFDQALDVSTGSIYKGGARFIHTQGGTALGLDALLSTSGAGNTAIGSEALRNNTTGNENTATGHGALFSNLSGPYNVACGSFALFDNTTGNANTACGTDALGNTTGSRNIGLGHNAGFFHTTGNDNIAIGNDAASPIPATESGTIRIGTAATHTNSTYMAGIWNTLVSGQVVTVDSSGHLGTTVSSRRFKKDIADMGELTERLLELRPVVFHYKQEQTVPGGGKVPLEYGLIAEEVAEIFPDLVVYDEDGQPFTVKYHLLSAMLLNELKKLDARFEAERETLDGLEERLAALESQVRRAPLPTAIPATSR